MNSPPVSAKRSPDAQRESEPPRSSAASPPKQAGSSGGSAAPSVPLARLSGRQPQARAESEFCLDTWPGNASCRRLRPHSSMSHSWILRGAGSSREGLSVKNLTSVENRSYLVRSVRGTRRTCFISGEQWFGLSGIQAVSQCCKSVTRRAAKVKVQPVGSGFFGNIWDGIDSKQADHCNFNTEFLQYFPAQRGFNHIVGQGVVAWSGRISGSRLKRPPGRPHAPLAR